MINVPVGRNEDECESDALETPATTSEMENVE